MKLKTILMRYVSSPHSMGHFEVGFLGLADACRAAGLGCDLRH